MTSRPLVELLVRSSPALVLWARNWCRTPEDVVQVAFCKLAALQVWPEDPLAWLYKVVRHGAMDAGKAERRRRHREERVARTECWFHETTVDGVDAERLTVQLQSLPVEQREAIVMKLWGGLTFDQMAVAVGSSVSTMHRRYEAGIATLRERLGEPCTS
jgi:RNA polymerase sigma factor (sigma-70 family)